MNTKPMRVQRLRKKGFNLQKYSMSINGLECVVVSRPTKWGNPFKVGKMYIPTDEIIRNPFNPNWETCKDIDQCLMLYKEYLDRELKYGRLKLDELKGKNLACFCSLSNKCHVDVLLETVSSACL